jgi:hypothetical protein
VGAVVKVKGGRLLLLAVSHYTYQVCDSKEAGGGGARNGHPYISHTGRHLSLTTSRNSKNVHEA